MRLCGQNRLPRRSLLRCRRLGMSRFPPPMAILVSFLRTSPTPWAIRARNCAGCIGRTLGKLGHDRTRSSLGPGGLLSMAPFWDAVMVLLPRLSWAAERRTDCTGMLGGHVSQCLLVMALSSCCCPNNSRRGEYRDSCVIIHDTRRASSPPQGGNWSCFFCIS